MNTWEKIEGKTVEELDLPVGTWVGYCGACGEKLFVKNGKFGKFIGCAGFKRWHNCRKTYNIKTYKIYNYDVLAHMSVSQKTKDIETMKEMLRKEDVWNWTPKEIQKIMNSHSDSEEVQELGKKLMSKLYFFMEYEASH